MKKAYFNLYLEERAADKNLVAKCGRFKVVIILLVLSQV